MQSSNQQMPCPVQNCSGTITFNTFKMLEGATFACPYCNSKVGLAPDSRNQVKEVMGEFATMRDQLLKKKKEVSNQ